MAGEAFPETMIAGGEKARRASAPDVVLPVRIAEATDGASASMEVGEALAKSGKGVQDCRMFNLDLRSFAFGSQHDDHRLPRARLGMAPALLAAVVVVAAVGAFRTPLSAVVEAALYPHDGRKLIEKPDEEKYRGAGVLMCFTDMGTLERAAAAWLIGARQLVVLNAHNFIDRSLRPSHPVENCFFRIRGVDRYFEPESLVLGVDGNSKSLHITDDWALLRLIEPVPDEIEPQPTPGASSIATGTKVKVVMVSPAGHSNSRLETSLEECAIQTVDEPSEARVRRARHDCNDGYGGSGSGLFTEDGRLIAMHSASLDMNAKRAFDIDSHYGSALLFEGALVEAIRREAAPKSR